MLYVDENDPVRGKLSEAEKRIGTRITSLSRQERMKTGAEVEKVDPRSSLKLRKWWAGRVLESDAGSG